MDRKENDVVFEDRIARGSFRAEPGREIRRVTGGSPISPLREVKHVGCRGGFLKGHAQSPSLFMGHTMEAESEQSERENYAEKTNVNEYRNG